MDQIILVTDINETTSPPPSGGNTNYIAWEFENNLTDTSSNLTWQKVDSFTESYVSGISQDAIAWNVDSDAVQFRIPDPGNDFVLDWGKAFAVSCWIKLINPSFEGIHILTLRDNSTTTAKNQDRIWVLNLFVDSNGDTSIGFQVAKNATNSIDLNQALVTPLVAGNWSFIYVRYDPINNKKIYISINGETEIEITCPNDFYFDTYNSDYSLAITGTNASNLNVELDQLVFWHTTAITRQDMLDLYNNGSGSALP